MAPRGARHRLLCTADVPSMPMPDDRPLHVAVDARCLNVAHLRGMGKSLFELVRRTSASGAVRWHLLADRPDRPMSAPRQDGGDIEVFDTWGHRIHSWEQWSLPQPPHRTVAPAIEDGRLHRDGSPALVAKPPAVRSLHSATRACHPDADRLAVPLERRHGRAGGNGDDNRPERRGSGRHRAPRRRTTVLIVSSAITRSNISDKCFT